MTEPFVDASQIAALIGKDRRWIYANQESLGIPRYKVGAHYRYRVGEVAAWVERLGE